MQLHHTLTKKMQAHGLEAILNGDRIEVRQGKKVVAFHTDPAQAVNKALERIEEERLRRLDPLPQDREPILLPRTTAKILPLRDAPRKIEITENGGKAIKGNVIKTKYRDKYRKSGSCGDDVAGEL